MCDGIRNHLQRGPGQNPSSREIPPPSPVFPQKKTTAQPPQASPPNAVHQQPASVACSTPPQSQTFPHVKKSLLDPTVTDLTMDLIISEKCQVVTDMPRPSL